MQSVLLGSFFVCALAATALADDGPAPTPPSPPQSSLMPALPSAQPDRVPAPDASLVTASSAPAERPSANARDEPDVAGPSAPAVSTAGAAVERRSPELATAGALLTTAAGWGLLFHGAFGGGGGAEVLAGLPMILVGPSVGHFYAGEVKHGLVTSGLRTGAFVVGGLGAIVFLAAHSFPGAVLVEQDQGRDAGALAVVAGGLVVVGGISLYDLWDAHHAVERHNERAVQARARFVVAPLVSGRELGLVLGGRF